MKRVYLDHNATTPMRPEVRALFLDRLERIGGNPSSVHRSGREARAFLDEARERTAAALGVHEDEIVFTSGGTESNQLAILGGVRSRGPKSGLLTSAIEHSAVLGAADALARAGRRVERAAVDRRGEIDVERFLASAREGWAGLVTLMAANNEIGTLAPLDRIGAGLADLGKKRPLFHADAVQALGRIPLDLRTSGLDLAAFSAHKVGGPLGVGILYRRKGTVLEGLVPGGGQEAGLRPGTENVPAISAAALAVALAVDEQPHFAERTRALSHSFWEQLQSVVPGVELNGAPIDSAARLPNTLNVTLPERDGARLDSRMLVARLDLEGLEISAGSACASGTLEPSHVLLALGHSIERARAGLRVSLGRATDEHDVRAAVEILRRTFRSSR